MKTISILATTLPRLATPAFSDNRQWPLACDPGALNAPGKPHGILSDMRKLLFLLLPVVALAQSSPPPEGLRCPERTLVLFDFQKENAAKAKQVHDEHIAYMVSLMKAGKVLSAGPTEDGRAVMIFAMTDWAGVEAIIKKEPFTREGVMKMASHTVWRACEPEK